MKNAEDEGEEEGEGEGKEKWLALKTVEAGGELLFTIHMQHEQWRIQRTKEKEKEKGKRRSSGNGGGRW